MSYMEDITLAVVIIGFIIGFILAFNLGANDVANAFGPAVGAKVLTFRQVCILATILETSGALLLGGRVAGTIAKGIVDIKLYEDNVDQLLLGYLASLIGAAAWLFIATMLKLPVSGTHSIVGAVLGFTLVVNGSNGVQWGELGKIVASWFISPLFSGIVSVILYLAVRFFVLNSSNQLKAGCMAMPCFYGITVAAIVYMILDQILIMAGFADNDPYGVHTWSVPIIGIGVGVIFAVCSYFFLMPIFKRKVEEFIVAEQQKEAEQQRRQVPKTTSITTLSGGINPVGDATSNYEIENGAHHAAANDVESTTSSAATKCACLQAFEAGMKKVEYVAGCCACDCCPSLACCSKIDQMQAKLPQETLEIQRLFRYIQVLTASYDSFAHGANDVSNAVGPILGMWIIYETGEAASTATPAYWILFYGGVGISFGIWILGKRVIETVGDGLAANLSSPNAFCMELGAALTVLIASHIGLPISTTHCLVGSIICVSLVRKRTSVDWSVCGNVVLSWIITVPASTALAAAAMAMLQAIFYSVGFVPDPCCGPNSASYSSESLPIGAIIDKL